jgi:phosphoribosyl 1,2-cyclic phosphodiesterase
VEGFRAGGGIRVAGLEISVIGTSHDGAEPVAFVLERAGARAGILTDLGGVSGEVRDVLPALEAVFLEANYDPHLLETGPYPKHLQRRIRSERGHLSNEEAGALLAECAGPGLRAVVLAHLSENNNRPAVALETVRRLAGGRLAERGATLLAAPRHDPSPVLHVGGGGEGSAHREAPPADEPTARRGAPSR